jgi:hypothetical protein
MGGVMVMMAEADFAASTTEEAVTVTVDPEGMADGAVYVMPLASALALKDPQAPRLPQVTDQVTRLFVEPNGRLAANVAAAASVAEAWMARDVGGEEINRTEVGSEFCVDGRFAPPLQPANPAIEPKPMSKKAALQFNIAYPIPGQCLVLRPEPSTKGKSRRLRR